MRGGNVQFGESQYLGIGPVLALFDKLVDERWAVAAVEFDAVSDVRDKAMTRITSTAFTTGIIDEKIFDITHFIINFNLKLFQVSGFMFQVRFLASGSSPKRTWNLNPET